MYVLESTMLGVQHRSLYRKTFTSLVLSVTYKLPAYGGSLPRPSACIRTSTEYLMLIVGTVEGRWIHFPSTVCAYKNDGPVPLYLRELYDYIMETCMQCTEVMWRITCHLEPFVCPVGTVTMCHIRVLMNCTPNSHMI